MDRNTDPPPRAVRTTTSVALSCARGESTSLVVTSGLALVLALQAISCGQTQEAGEASDTQKLDDESSIAAVVVASEPDASGGSDSASTDPNGGWVSEENRPLNSVGVSCVNDAGCAGNEFCVDPPAGRCGCDPQLVACGASCRDLATDVQNCGACGRACLTGQGCNQGLCGMVITPAFEFGPIQQLSTGIPADECVPANEGVPARSFSNSQPGAGTTDVFISYQSRPIGGTTRNFNNWASSWNNWRTTPQQTPVAANTESSADAWATSHGGTGLEYVAAHGATNGSASNCLAIGAATRSNLQTNNFSPPGFPLTCVEPSNAAWRVDGPAIYFDPGANNLYAAYAEVPNGVGSLTGKAYGFINCAGTPGGGSCPISWKITTNGSLIGHNNVIVNPCTRHPIFLDRSASGVHMHIFDTAGTLIKNFTVANVSYNKNSNCGGAPCGAGNNMICKCTGVASNDCGTAGCAEVAPRVHASAKYDSITGKCYVYLGYDRSCAASNGNTYMKAAMSIVDVTAEANPTVVVTRQASPCTAAHNEFNTRVSAHYFARDAGFFYYRQRDGDACQTYIGAQVDENLAITSITNAGYLTGPFPTMRHDLTRGLGHYSSSLYQFQLPGGWLFDSWSEPVATNIACTSCQGTNYTLSIRGTRIKP
jgi:hypothetical protein